MFQTCSTRSLLLLMITLVLIMKQKASVSESFKSGFHICVPAHWHRVGLLAVETCRVVIKEIIRSGGERPHIRARTNLDVPSG